MFERLFHEARAAVLAAGLGHETFENLTFLIDRAPQVMGRAVDFHVDLINVPSPVAVAPHSSYNTTRRITLGEELKRRNGLGGRARDLCGVARR